MYIAELGKVTFTREVGAPILIIDSTALIALLSHLV